MDDKDRIYRELIIQLIIRCYELYYQNKLKKDVYGSIVTKINNTLHGNCIAAYPKLNGDSRSKRTEEYLKAYV